MARAPSADIPRHDRFERRLSAALVAVMLVGVAVVGAILLFASGGGGGNAPVARRANPTTVENTPFASNSIWNAPVSTAAPVASNSTALVGDLQRQVSSFGSWINTSSFSVPIYTVPASQKRVPVVLDAANHSADAERLGSAFKSGVPIPAGATPAPGSDKDLVIWQPSTNTLWELWVAQQEGSTWHADWGGKMGQVSSNPGYFTNPPDWGTAATSLSLLGGTATIAEIRSGHIDHALSISIPQARQGVFASPAQRTDGKLNNPNAIPEGTHFRLDPRLNVDRLGLPRVTTMLAKAAQRYGIFVRDQGGSVSFYAQQNTTGHPDPYGGPSGLFGGMSPRALTQAFPWSHLQVLSAPLHRAS
jgi:hypothetical protein